MLQKKYVKKNFCGLKGEEDCQKIKNYALTWWTSWHEKEKFLRNGGFCAKYLNFLIHIPKQSKRMTVKFKKKREKKKKPIIISWFVRNEYKNEHQKIN